METNSKKIRQGHLGVHWRKERSVWELCQYSFRDEVYHAFGGNIFTQCIPYKGNEHLLGTTDTPLKGDTKP